MWWTADEILPESHPLFTLFSSRWRHGVDCCSKYLNIYSHSRTKIRVAIVDIRRHPCISYGIRWHMKIVLFWLLSTLQGCHQLHCTFLNRKIITFFFRICCIITGDRQLGSDTSNQNATVFAVYIWYRANSLTPTTFHITSSFKTLVPIGFVREMQCSLGVCDASVVQDRTILTHAHLHHLQGLMKQRMHIVTLVRGGTY